MNLFFELPLSCTDATVNISARAAGMIVDVRLNVDGSTMRAALAADNDVLIGMDVLRTCKLILDGPGSQFSMDF